MRKHKHSPTFRYVSWEKEVKWMFPQVFLIPKGHARPGLASQRPVAEGDSPSKQQQFILPIWYFLKLGHTINSEKKKLRRIWSRIQQQPWPILMVLLLQELVMEQWICNTEGVFFFKNRTNLQDITAQKIYEVLTSF